MAYLEVLTIVGLAEDFGLIEVFSCGLQNMMMAGPVAEKYQDLMSYSLPSHHDRVRRVAKRCL